MPLSAETREHLKRASTATLTTQLFKRGLRNVFIQGVRRMSAASDNLVGEALRCAISRRAKISTS